MRIHTTARHCELDSEDRLFVEGRLAKFEKFARDIQEIHVVVTAEGNRHVAEITMHLKQRNVVSREESTEARRAIDMASDRLEHQLRRLHERRVDHKRSEEPNGKHNGVPVEGDGDAAFEDLEED